MERGVTFLAIFGQILEGKEEERGKLFNDPLGKILEGRGRGITFLTIFWENVRREGGEGQHF